MRKIFIALALAGLAAGALPSTAAAGSNRAVVELFTSQGCSSCPPADAFLADLADRDDVLALSFHVDYWNYIGWKDPFSSPEATARQKDYRNALGGRYVYTPQMVVNGSAETVGVHRSEVLALVDSTRARKPVEIAIDRKGAEGATIQIGGGPAQDKAAAVLLVLYDDRHTTDVRRGENMGARLTNRNVVREFGRIGSWWGKAATFDLSFSEIRAAGHDGCAIIVQSHGSGPILGAVSFRLPRPRS